MKLLALDFDGVISDSAPECFAVALEAFREHFPDSPLRALADEGVGAPPYDAERIRAHPAFRAFVRMMPLGNRAEDFGVVMAAIARDEEIEDQEAYDARRDSMGEDFLAGFHQSFYRRRNAFAARAPAEWLRLMGSYPPFVEALRRLRGEVPLAIATAKDGPTLRALLREYGIAELFAENAIADKEAGVHKSGHLRLLSRSQGVPLEDITFVDDKVNHLEGVAPLGVRCVLAGWGYNGERERSRALSLGFRVAGLGDFEAQLLDARAPR